MASPLDILDHSAPSIGAGTKIGFDATRRMPGEEVGLDLELPQLPDEEQIAVTDTMMASRDRRWEVEGDRGDDGGARERVASEGWFSSPSRSERLC